MSQKIRQDINIGSRLRELRQEQVVVQLQLEGLDISRSSYSQIECGTYNIRVSELKALVKLFHTDYNTIFS